MGTNQATFVAKPIVTPARASLWIIFETYLKRPMEIFALLLTPLISGMQVQCADIKNAYMDTLNSGLNSCCANKSGAIEIPQCSDVRVEHLSVEHLTLDKHRFDLEPIEMGLLGDAQARGGGFEGPRGRTLTTAEKQVWQVWQVWQV